MTTIEVYTDNKTESKSRLVDALIECKAQLLDTKWQRDETPREENDVFGVLLRVPADKVEEFCRIAGVTWYVPPRA
jgi:hypothetical protein